jgi:hypothetical protein
MGCKWNALLERSSRSESKFPWDRSVNDNDVWGGMKRGERGQHRAEEQLRIQNLSVHQRAPNHARDETKGYRQSQKHEGT